jgi:type 1 glutamine amidotransferase
MKKQLLLSGFALLFVCSVQSCSSSVSEPETPPVTAEQETNDPSRILVFSKTSGYYHESIPDGIAAIQKLGSEHNVQVDTTKNAAYFNPDSLQQYEAVVFLSTTMDVLDATQQAAFEKYIQAGGGFAGIHAAADTEYDWPWYNKLVGAYFKSHPEQQNATVRVKDKSHPSTSHLPDDWEIFDELYNYKDINPDVNVLATLDESTYKGGENGEHHPIVWYHEYDGGRAFYTGLGHTKESYGDAVFLQHMWGGITYAMGQE